MIKNNERYYNTYEKFNYEYEKELNYRIHEEYQRVLMEKSARIIPNSFGPFFDIEKEVKKNKKLLLIK